VGVFKNIDSFFIPPGRVHLPRLGLTALAIAMAAPLYKRLRAPGTTTARLGRARTGVSLCTGRVLLDDTFAPNCPTTYEICSVLTTNSFREPHDLVRCPANRDELRVSPVCGRTSPEGARVGRARSRTRMNRLGFRFDVEVECRS
jgi:hypothetical protein